MANSVRLSRAYDWQFPYPAAEHELRVMCGDPVATAYHALECWVTAQKFYPEVTMRELIQCLWANHYGNSMTAWSLTRNNGTVSLPADIPDGIFNQAWNLYASSEKASPTPPKRKLFP